MSEIQAEQKRSWGVLVMSFDGNSDLWPLFFHFLFREWPDIPTPVYLLTNFKTYDDPRVISLKVGQDTSWGHGMQKALDLFPHENVFTLLEDFFLKSPVQTETVDSLIKQWNLEGGRYLETGRNGSVTGPRNPGSPFRQFNAEYPRAGINSAVYTKELLRFIAQPGLNLWQANTRLGDQNRANLPGFFYSAEDQKPPLVFEECVRGRFWKPHAVEFLKKTGMVADFKKRPCPVQGRDVFSRFIRSLYKRKMSKARKLDNQKLLSNWSCTVSPLGAGNQVLPENWKEPKEA